MGNNRRWFGRNPLLKRSKAIGPIVFSGMSFDFDKPGIDVVQLPDAIRKYVLVCTRRVGTAVEFVKFPCSSRFMMSCLY